MKNSMADYHIHSFFSGDCNTPLDEIASSAIKNGLSSICITDHLDFDYEDNNISFLLDKDEYYYSICKFRDKYMSTLDIRIGVETGLEPDKAQRLDDFLCCHNYDFIIGSSHLVNGFDPYYPEYFSNKSDYDAFLEYFQSISRNIDCCTNYDVYGHLDYVVRYSPNKDKYYFTNDYIDIIDEILIKLISKGKGIEINTSGYRSGLSDPNPNFQILKRYKELGGEILTIGSDAHYPEHIAYNFDKIYCKIKECGFEYYTQFKNRRPEFIKL